MKINLSFSSITNNLASRLLLFILFCALLTISLNHFLYKSYNLEHQLNVARSDYEKIQDAYATTLLNDHLTAIELAQLKESKTQIEKDYQLLKSDASKEKLVKIEELYSLYNDALKKIDRNNKVNVSTKEITDKFGDWGNKLLEQKFDELKTALVSAGSELDKKYQTYLASIAPPPPAPTPAPSPAPAPPVPQAQGYSYRTVATSRGSFGVYLIKMELSAVTVKTVSANQSDCVDGCPTKSLSQYIQENGAYAGINGSYFCPPDYASCVGKVNSYDFAFYNSNLGAWLNEKTLAWTGIGWGLATFIGQTPRFYADIGSYDRSGVTAGISNFPALLQDGNNVADESKMTAYQKNNRGLRGFIGVDATNIYLGIVSGATVPDTAVVAQALGARDALNIDGGGSSALYISGSYKVGPGRSLPNAVLLVKN